ncbi:MAG TPA: protein phosphatase 2C domain-containing protein [Bryobacteraceae bacterium]|nr:protein phosphatase 2C domain-containing protein [Bryobacteraceae bacterium]
MRFLTNTITAAGGRERNQDSFQFWVTETSACWVLADGLGGHGGGEEAAQVATEAVLKAFQSHAECSAPALLTYIEFARNAVAAKQAENPALSAMRTTMVILVSDMKNALWAHVGDSRLYYFKQRRLERQTADHSVPQAMVDAGQLKASAIRRHEDRNRLLRSLGGREEVRATIEESVHTVGPEDAFLLCSDGFWEYVTETAMEVDLAKSAHPGEWLRHMQLRIRAAAPEDQDNYSAVGVFAAP